MMICTVPLDELPEDLAPGRNGRLPTTEALTHSLRSARQTTDCRPELLRTTWPDRLGRKCVGRRPGRSPADPARTSRLQSTSWRSDVRDDHGEGDLARLTDEELLDAYFRDGDPADRDELAIRYMPFARKLAIRYIHSREPLDDLVQVACIGLLNAIDRFDPEHGKKFTAFAAPTILGEIKRYFRDKGWSVHVPRDLQERALALSRHAERLSIELGRSPTVVELADALGCTVEQTVEAIDAGESYQLTSLDAPVAQEDDDRCTLVDMLGGRGRRVRACRRPTGARE